MNAAEKYNGDLPKETKSDRYPTLGKLLNF
jgi:hypothetical protein